MISLTYDQVQQYLRSLRAFSLLICICLMMLPNVSAYAQTGLDKEASKRLLQDMRKVAIAEAFILERLRTNQHQEAARLASQSLKEHPEANRLWVLWALIKLGQGKPNTALEAIKQAVELGFSDLNALLDDPIFAELNFAPGMSALLTQSEANLARKTPRPATITDGEVLLDHTNISWLAQAGRFVALLSQPPQSDVVVAPNSADRDMAFLRRLAQQGKAGGLTGVLYDNRDNDHSPFPHRDFPQLTRVNYSEILRHGRLHYGPAEVMLFPNITFGNSSTASRGITGRSNSRAGMTQNFGPQKRFLNYTNDHIYVFPEHKDHDAHDKFPANWPYNFTSQGSSYLDQPILKAIAQIIAAFPKDTRDRLDALNLVAPTVQMVFRRAQTGVRTRGAYLSGLAHPTVFPSDVISPERMMSLASSLQASQIPPMVSLRVLSETFTDQAGLGQKSEKLFDTGSAVARLWRNHGATNEMTVSVAETKDPNGHPLSFTWVLLRGDPALVSINPSDDGTQAQITLNWHDKRRITPRGDRTTSRVDIGVFAHNGFHDSAPAFISVDFPTHQIREYVTDAEGRARIASIDFDALSRKADFDPELYWSANWTDRYSYNADGRISAVERVFRDGSVQTFDADGSNELVGAPYQIVPDSEGYPMLTAQK